MVALGCLGIGTTLAYFQSLGGWLRLMEWLKRAVIDGTIAIAVCFNIFQEIPSGPLALGSIQWRQHSGNLFYSAKQIGARIIPQLESCGLIGEILQLKFLQKNEFRTSASSWSVEYTLESLDWTGMEEFCLFRIFTDFQNCFGLEGFSLWK